MALPLPLCPPRMVHYYWKSPFQQTHHDLQLCASFPQYTSSPSPFDPLLFLSYYYASLPAGDRAEHYLPCSQYLFWAFRKSRLFLIFTLVAFRQILRDPERASQRGRASEDVARITRPSGDKTKNTTTFQKDNPSSSIRLLQRCK